MKDTILVRGARQLLTLRGPSGPRRGGALRDLGIIPDGALLIHNGTILDVGPGHRIENLSAARDAREINAAGRVVMPGFVDSHTHLVFGASRLDDFEMRIAGATREEIAGAGEVSSPVFAPSEPRPPSASNGGPGRWSAYGPPWHYYRRNQVGVWAGRERRMEDAPRLGVSPKKTARCDPHVPGRPRNSARVSGQRGRLYRLDVFRPDAPHPPARHGGVCRCIL